MDLSLSSLEDGFIKNAVWNHEGDLVLHAVDAIGQSIEIVFRNIRFLKLVESQVHNWTDDNEIWKLEEIQDSSLIKEVVQENERNGIRATFGGYYQRVTSVNDPHLLHHYVLLSDYLDIELMCTECSIMLLKE